MIGEIFLYAIWWDYSNSFLNIHGRTCLYYAILWGILSIFLINYINPLINQWYAHMERAITLKKTKIIIAVLVAFFIADSTVTCFALENFLINVSNEYGIAVKGIDIKEDNKILSKYFPNEKMMMIYPNIIVINEKDEIIYLESILKNVKNYYYKFGKTN